jgi:hypothetical protein
MNCPQIVGVIKSRQSSQLISAHNDGIIRRWDCNLKTSEVLYDRSGDRPIIKLKSYESGQIVHKET